MIQLYPFASAKDVFQAVKQHRVRHLLGGSHMKIVVRARLVSRIYPNQISESMHIGSARLRDTPIDTKEASALDELACHAHRAFTSGSAALPHLFDKKGKRVGRPGSAGALRTGLILRG